MRVPVEVRYCKVPMNGTEIDGVEISCTDCDHSVKIAGETDRSIRRGCATLKDQCPKNGDNFYVVVED